MWRSHNNLQVSEVRGGTGEAERDSAPETTAIAEGAISSERKRDDLD